MVPRNKPVAGSNTIRAGREAIEGISPRPAGTQKKKLFRKPMADKVGFEPTVRFHAHTRSRRAP
jgi:hypothetical protein